MEQPVQPISPPTPPETRKQPKNLSNLNVNKLGYFLDGWADLVENNGDKATEVKQLVFQYLAERNMPEVEVKQVNGSVGLGTNKRPYNITATSPGATTAIYVGEHGRDLYVSWRTFIKPVLSNLVAFLLLLSFLVGLYSADKAYNFSYGSSFSSLGLQNPVIATVVAFLTTFIFLFALLALLVAALGVVLKGDFRAYFFIEPNIFDAEDITAMGLSVHKSLIRSLDTTGIDVTELRLKQNFKGGRKGETV